ncbi:hypothetical protein VTL71DRAFT_14615 [Oculimacula yallundae]|uniref:Cytochrome P450 n=1 Tax=Oculimacula yallundae TaxID=86028 RepID=A0ABR4CKC4_9HELO
MGYSLTFFLGLNSLFSAYAMWGRLYRYGYYDAMVRLRDLGPHVLPGSSHPILTTYTGIGPLDRLATFSVVFFSNVTDGSAPQESLFGLYFGGQLAAMLTLTMIEAARIGNRKTSFTLPAVWWLAMQIMGYGCIMPLYAMCHLLTSPTASTIELEAAKHARVSNLTPMKVLIPSIVVGYFYLLPFHAIARTDMFQEIDAVVGRERLPTWEDEKQLIYTRALIKEVHRWAPIGSIGIPHATTEDIHYQGCFIPKGAILLPNLVTLNRDGDRYDNPEEFDPRRHLGDELDASASAVQADYMKRDHFHYGFGRRLCLGIFIAEASLFIAIARILWAFDIQALPGLNLDMKDKIYGLTTKPKPFHISISSRAENLEARVDAEMNKTRSAVA